MSDLTPYELWIEEASPSREFPLVHFTGAHGLNDAAAITQALVLLQDVIDAINENPGLIQIRTDIITPPAFNLRIARRQEDLGE